MEKRLLLAFVLSLAVFIGWGAFMAQFQPPTVKKMDTARNLEKPLVPSSDQNHTIPVAPSSQAGSQSVAIPASKLRLSLIHI